jgi:hypothetical protein
VLAEVLRALGHLQFSRVKQTTMATIAQLRQQSGAEADGGAILNQLLARPMGAFDPDAWHVMQERDNALIRDELMHGNASRAFVYEFDLKGSKVRGISVVGARELASQYKGIKSKIVATVEKRGALFIFRTFSPLSIDTRTLPELEADDDFYECVMEVSDIKTGNSIEVRKKETRTERKRDGTRFERPHFDVIAESKAFRNGVLSVLPQSVIKEFQARCLAAGEASQELTISEWRSKALAYGAKNGVALDRAAVAGLTFDEITGLGGAAGQGLDHFKRAAGALGLILSSSEGADPQTGEIPPPAAKTTERPRPTQAPAPEQGPRSEWEPSAEEAAANAAREQAEADGRDSQAPNPSPAPAARRARAAVRSME